MNNEKQEASKDGEEDYMEKERRRIMDQLNTDSLSQSIGSVDKSKSAYRDSISSKDKLNKESIGSRESIERLNRRLNESK